MSTSIPETVTWSPEETRMFAEKFAAENLRPGMVVALKGELGAGKTCFAQGSAWGLGVDRHTYLSSPTFTLVKEYRGRMAIYHIDLYRLESEEEALDIGIEDYLSGGGVALIEWPEKIERVLGNENLVTVEIEALSENERKIRIHTGD